MINLPLSPTQRIVLGAVKSAFQMACVLVAVVAIVSDVNNSEGFLIQFWKACADVTVRAIIAAASAIASPWTALIAGSCVAFGIAIVRIVDADLKDAQRTFTAEKRILLLYVILGLALFIVLMLAHAIPDLDKPTVAQKLTFILLWLIGALDVHGILHALKNQQPANQVVR